MAIARPRYSERALLTGTIDGVAQDGRAHRRSSALLQELCRRRRIVVVPSYDPEGPSRLTGAVFTDPSHMTERARVPTEQDEVVFLLDHDVAGVVGVRALPRVDDDQPLGVLDRVAEDRQARRPVPVREHVCQPRRARLVEPRLDEPRLDLDLTGLDRGDARD